MLFASLIWGLLCIIRCRRHFVFYYGVGLFKRPQEFSHFVFTQFYHYCQDRNSHEKSAKVRKYAEYVIVVFEKEAIT